MSRLTRMDRKLGSSRAVDLVNLQAMTEWVQLQIEGCSLHSLLFVACQPGKAGRERIGESELHCTRYSGRSTYLVYDFPVLSRGFDLH